MTDKTARKLFGVRLVLVGIAIVIACSMGGNAQWIDVVEFQPPADYDTVWFGDGYMNVHLSPGQLPPYIINISDLEYIEAVYVDGTEVSLESIDPLASFIGGIFIGMAVLFLLVGI